MKGMVMLNQQQHHNLKYLETGKILKQQFNLLAVEIVLNLQMRIHLHQHL